MLSFRVFITCLLTQNNIINLIVLRHRRRNTTVVCYVNETKHRLPVCFVHRFLTYVMKEQT